MRTTLAVLTADDVVALDSSGEDVTLIIVITEKTAPVRGLTLHGHIRTCLREACDFQVNNGCIHGIDTALQTFERINRMAHAYGDVVQILVGEG